MKRSIFVFLLIIFQYCPFVILAQIHDSNDTHSPGVLVDAGGHKLHLYIRGKGSPTVIFENGSGDFSFIWTLVQPEVSKFTKTVSYDRAGYAWSEQGPFPRTSKQICFELHTALKNKGINPPYILVGQSFGGFIVRAFARYYPKEVAGMVLVEAVQENQKIFMGGDTPRLIREFATGRITPEPQTFFKPQQDTSTQKPALNTEIDPLFDKLPDSVRKMQIWAQSQPQFIKAVQGEMEWSPEDVANLYSHKGENEYVLADMPLIVITRGKGGYEGRADSLQLEKERLNAQEELVHLSTNSKHIIDMNSGHNVHVEDPNVVIASIKDVFVAVSRHLKLN
ncbi:MAG TPA: alpha/beta hydrolase [Puia sp.]|nr:alpha/beta hydrolase [Puia sp.]